MEIQLLVKNIFDITKARCEDLLDKNISLIRVQASKKGTRYFNLKEDQNGLTSFSI